MITFRKYRFALALLFFGIFALKMLIAGAPVMFSHFDKKFMKAVIMQLEEERKAEDSKDSIKHIDQKLMCPEMDYAYEPPIFVLHVANSFFEHSRRYVDPYHPLVPTPPPNV